jgi:hypothetical protein
VVGENMRLVWKVNLAYKTLALIQKAYTVGMPERKPIALGKIDINDDAR